MNINVSHYISKLQDSPEIPIYQSMYWADYLELLCLANLDGEVSKSDLISRLSKRFEDLGEGDIDDAREMESMEDELQFTTTNRSTKPDKWNERLDNWFMILEHRTSLHGINYPFTVENDSLILTSEALSEGQLAYIYLLLSSNLYLFNGADSIILSSSFELFCLTAAKNFLPKNAEVHLFGKSPINEGIFVGKALDKIKLLASKINEHIKTHSPDAYPNQNTGDDGLDVVCWVPTGDELSSKLVYFGQCTCSRSGWELKQSSSSHQVWSNKINLTNYVNNILFIPFCYRSATGTWFNSMNISQILFIDRKRLLHYLCDDYQTFAKLPSYELVKTIVSAKEDIN